MKLPWTREELEAALPQVRAQLEAMEAEDPDAKPLPPMTEEECYDYMWRLMDSARQRPLTQQECFLFGQLVSNYRMAVKATTLGYTGRYFVISEDEVAAQIKGSEGK